MTIVVAIVTALALPVSQLRTRYVTTTCCCPDPSHCHCPDHKPGDSGVPAMRACHKEAHEIVSPVPPAIDVPEVAVAPAEPRVTVAIASPIPAPHAAPAPRRPDAPS